MFLLRWLRRFCCLTLMWIWTRHNSRVRRGASAEHLLGNKWNHPNQKETDNDPLLTSKSFFYHSMFCPGSLFSQQLGEQLSLWSGVWSQVWHEITFADSTCQSAESDTLKSWPQGRRGWPAEMLRWVERRGMQPRQVVLFVLHTRGQSIACGYVKTDWRQTVGENPKGFQL